MDKRGGKSSKVERIKMRKKILENEGLLKLSKGGHIPSENISKNENLIRETIVKKKAKLSGKKRKEQNVTEVAIDKVDHPSSHGKDSAKKRKYEKSVEGKDEKKKKKLSKKKRNKQIVSGANVNEIDDLDSAGEDGSKKLKDGGLETKKSARLQEVDVAVHKRTKKSKKVGKKKDLILSEMAKTLVKEENGSVASDVYHISSVDVDSSKGMKKWITEYHQSRPGLEILQQRIDEFITSHEEREEQIRNEKKAKISGDGWTVVEHQKGRKKTTDAESGTTMGSVAQAAVVEKMKNVKKKDVGPDFYRFQKREAQRNEIMMLQSKFEQDKKRIQQLRAARKFRPY